MKHLVCYSGGHSSALVAIEVFRKFGSENLVLLNHDINARVEDEDIKRFKKEVALYIGIPITFANHKNFEIMDQFDIAEKHGGFLAGDGNRASMSAVCTRDLKTRPFQAYLDEHFPEKNVVIYYGFDKSETHRIQRRSSILAASGFKSDYPLAFWERTINSTEEIGIKPPLTYSKFKHANCVGCIKAGKQHWFVVYCTRIDIFEKAKKTEEKLDYTILKGVSLAELEPKFQKMKFLGIEPTEHVKSQTFWAKVRGILSEDKDEKPCECVF